jgi:DNA-binding NarL/FixJ family response regulator
MLYSRCRMPVAFIVARDRMLRAGVRAELRGHGIEALGMEEIGDAAAAIAEGTAPSVIVVEGMADLAGAAALARLARRVPVIVVASRMTPLTPPAGAKMMFRPVTVGEVVAEVERILKGTEA